MKIRPQSQITNTINVWSSFDADAVDMCIEYQVYFSSQCTSKVFAKYVIHYIRSVYDWGCV